MLGQGQRFWTGPKRAGPDRRWQGGPEIHRKGPEMAMKGQCCSESAEDVRVGPKIVGERRERARQDQRWLKRVEQSLRGSERVRQAEVAGKPERARTRSNLVREGWREPDRVGEGKATIRVFLGERTRSGEKKWVRVWFLF